MAAGAGALSGLLLLIAFPPADLGIIGFVALVPLAIYFKSAPAKGLAVASTVFGFVFFGGLLSWLNLFGLAPFLAAVLALTGWVVLALAAGRWIKDRIGTNWSVAIFPLAYLSSEYLRSRLPLGGFPWGGLGYTQHNLSTLRLAPYTGVWGISLLLALVAAMIGESLMFAKSRPRSAGIWAAGASLLAVAPATIRPGVSNGRTANIAMIQSNVPEGLANPHDDDWTVVENHVRLTKQIAPRRPDLVIWPESAFDQDPYAVPAFGKRLEETVKQTGTYFLVGAILRSHNPKAGDLENASLFLEPDAHLAGTYVKQHPVPFGERVPFRKLLTPFIKQLSRVPLDMVAGPGPRVFSLPQGRFGSVICYESAYPGLVRGLVRKGARFLVVSTNDSSFKRSPAGRQHLAFSQIRAAEQRMWIAHTALSGPSAVISPSGQITAQTKMFKPAVLMPTIRFATRITPYARFGDWVPAGAFLALAALGLASFRMGRAQLAQKQ